MPAFGLSDLFGKKLGLFLELDCLIAEAGILLDDAVEFGVDGKMACPHLIVQILMIVLHFDESYIGVIVLFYILLTLLSNY